MNTAPKSLQRTQITHLFAWIAGAVAIVAWNAPTLGRIVAVKPPGAWSENEREHPSVQSGLIPAQPDTKSPSPQPSSEPGKTTPDSTAKPSVTKAPSSFLLDSSKKPHVRISWPSRDKSTVTLEADLEYQAPKQSVPIGNNLSAYVALGGTRGDLGLGAPGAVDVRVGFYKLDKTKPMFDSLADDAAITVDFTGISFNQPGVAKPSTALQHLKFEGNTTVLGCAGDPGVLATYNTLDAAQTIGDLITRKNGRLGALSQKTGSVQASVSLTTEKDGSVAMKAVIPYALFKHADDPWLRANPGEFTEPVHFHIEFECEPLSKPTQQINATPKQAK